MIRVFKAQARWSEYVEGLYQLGRMLTQVVCMAEGGIPLYSRPAEPGKQLPFSVISSLNGVHMFGGGQGVELLTTCSSTGKLAWRNFHNTITMMLVTDDNQSSEAYLQRLLTSFFDAMVLLVGLEDLANIKNVERLKRDLRVSVTWVQCCCFIEVTVFVIVFYIHPIVSLFVALFLMHSHIFEVSNSKLREQIQQLCVCMCVCVWGG
uniref:FUZ/MON1/HPS1 first Longin domain-containing protein n=1 Tax=Eptatretus burgeri TaxID=7764 RepID=A0A8C4Q938_EPTBU